MPDELLGMEYDLLCRLETTKPRLRLLQNAVVCRRSSSTTLFGYLQCVNGSFRMVTLAVLVSAHDRHMTQSNNTMDECEHILEFMEESMMLVQYIAKKYHGGVGEAEKALVKEEGWEWHNLLSIMDEDFKDRHYNAAWAEHILQSFMESGPLCQKIDVEWGALEPAPFYGDNYSKIPDNERINLYLCLKFED